MSTLQKILTAASVVCTFILSGGENKSGITLLSPQPKSTVPLLQEEHKKFWKEAEDRRKFDAKHWKKINTIINTKKDNCKPAEVEFVWKCDFKAKKYILVLSGDGEVRHFCTGTQTGIRVDNLRIGTNYLWFVDAEKNDGSIERSQTGFFCTEDQPPRWINLPGVSNVRDVGGWKTADGKKRIRQGLVYRGGEFDGHQNITPEGKLVVRDILRLRTDWDLRSYSASGMGMTEYPLKALGIHLINRPATFTPAGMAAVMHSLATLQEYPVYIHCWGGADRTGKVIFTLQALLGVGDEDLFTDYEMTSFGRWGTRSRNKTAGSEIRSFLKLIDKYGKPGDNYAVKVEAFLRAGGLSQADIDTLRNLLLEKI